MTRPASAPRVRVSRLGAACPRVWQEIGEAHAAPVRVAPARPSLLARLLADSNARAVVLGAVIYLAGAAVLGAAVSLLAGIR